MIRVRIKGYVIGYDVVGGELLWRVKVKDSSSIHDGKKFVVHSLHPGTMLSRPSVDVSFRVEPVQVGQEQNLKAVDVAVGEIISIITPVDVKPENADAVSFVASVLDGELSVSVTGLNSREEFKKELMGSEEEIISFFRISYNMPKNIDGVLPDVFCNSMEILHRLLCSADIQPAFEYLLTQVFTQGRQSVLNERN